MERRAGIPVGPQFLLPVSSLALLLFCCNGFSDLLITTNGARYWGTVKEKGESFVVVADNGGEMTFPKTVVKKVIRSAEAQAQYNAMHKAADLRDDGQVERLLQFAKDNEMLLDSDRLVKEVYQLRRESAKESPDWQALAQWCRAHSLTTEAQACGELAAVETLAAKGDIPGLTAMLLKLEKGPTASAVVPQCARRIYQLRLASCGDDPRMLADLAEWCWQYGMNMQRLELDAMVLKHNPDDQELRRKLGYVRDKDTRTWVRQPWKVGLVGASAEEKYSESSPFYGVYAKAKNAGTTLAEVNLTLESATASEDDVRVFDELIDKCVSALGAEDGAERNKWRKLIGVPPGTPTRLLLSSEVRLVLKDGSVLIPLFTSRPDGSGVTIVDKSLTGEINILGGAQVQCNYIRMVGLTAVALRPNDKITLAFIYLVPNGTADAKLMFYDNAPVTVRFKKE